MILKKVNNLFSILMLASLALQANADTIEPKNISNILINEKYSCGIIDGKINCWASNRWFFDAESYELSPGKIAYPRKITGDEYTMCAAHADGLACWGTHGHNGGPVKTPQIQNPIDVAVAGGAVCAINSTELKCEYLLDEPPLVTGQLQQVKLTDHNHGRSICVLADAGLHCSVGGRSISVAAPEIKGLKFFSFFGQFPVAYTNSGMKCWSGPEGWGGAEACDLFLEFSKRLQNPKAVESRTIDNGDGVLACALDDSGVKCLRKNYSETVAYIDLPQLAGIEDLQLVGNNRYPIQYEACGIRTNGYVCAPVSTDDKQSRIFIPSGIDSPKLLASNGKGNCVLDGLEIKCWGGKTSPYDHDDDYSLSYLKHDLVTNIKTPKLMALNADGLIAIAGKTAAGKNAIELIPWATTKLAESHILIPQNDEVKELSFGATEKQSQSDRVENALCSLTSEEVNCYYSMSGDPVRLGGHFPVEPNQKLKNPRSMTPLSYVYDTTFKPKQWAQLCLIDDEGLKCWSHNWEAYFDGAWTSYLGDAFSKAVSLNKDKLGSLIIDRDGIYFDDYYLAKNLMHKYPFAPPSDIRAVSRSAGSDGNLSCANDAGKVRCWNAFLPTMWGAAKTVEEWTMPASFINPLEIVAGNEYVCGIFATGIQCFGKKKWGQLDVPLLDLTGVIK